MSLQSLMSRRSLVRSLVTAVVAVTLLTIVRPAPVIAQQGAASNGPLFTVLIFERPADLALRTNPQKSDAYWTAYDEFAGFLAQQGALRGGSALSESASALARGSRGADGQGVRLGGYFVIAAADLAAARALATKAPAFAVAVEVRPHRDNPHMMKPGNENDRD